MRVTRRDVLRFGAASAALSLFPFRQANLFAGEAAGKKKIPIGLQLYSLREVAPKDMAGTLDEVAKMGYQGVEFAGYHGLRARRLRRMLEQSGLKCCGSHVGIESLTGDALKATVEFNLSLGNPYLIVPGLDPKRYFASIATTMDTAKQLTELADKVKELDLRVGYHAHASDFQPLADRIPWEVLFTSAGPNVVMQLDTGNCMSAGCDPVAILKKFPGRSVTIHLKEFGGPADAAVGQGKVPWKEVFEACETVGGTEWYIVEQETSKAPMQSVALCLKNLREMGK